MDICQNRKIVNGPREIETGSASNMPESNDWVSTKTGTVDFDESSSTNMGTSRTAFEAAGRAGTIAAISVYKNAKFKLIIKL